jgi:hypothetical protein
MIKSSDATYLPEIQHPTPEEDFTAVNLPLLPNRQLRRFEALPEF